MAVKVPAPNHWTTREVPCLCLEYPYSRPTRGNVPHSSIRNPQAQELMSRCSGAGACGISTTVFSCDCPFEYIHLVLSSSNHLTDAHEGLLYARHFEGRPFWEWPGLAFSTALQGFRKKMYILFNCPPASLSQCLDLSF